jgi:hypothetical protein
MFAVADRADDRDRLPVYAVLLAVAALRRARRRSRFEWQLLLSPARAAVGLLEHDLLAGPAAYALIGARQPPAAAGLPLRRRERWWPAARHRRSSPRSASVPCLRR